MFGYLFLSTLGPQPNILTLSTLVFLLLQKFEFTLHFKFCCVIREWWSDINPSCYLKPWLDSVHQSYTAGACLREELIGISSLGADEFILLSLKLELLRFINSSWPRSNCVTSNWQEVSNGFFTKRCTYCPISQSYLIQNLRYWDLSKLHDRVVITHQYLCFDPMESSPKAMIISCPRPILGFKLEIQRPLAKISRKMSATMATTKILVFWIVIRTQKCFVRRSALSALLIVFHCIIWLLIAFHFIALLIELSK